MLAPLTDPVMAGFVWHLTEDGNPFDAGILFNLSFRKSPDALKQFVCRTSHAELLAAREEWFQRVDVPYVALWCIPAGAVPSAPEARARLEHLREHGDSPYAFRFQSEFAKAAVA